MPSLKGGRKERGRKSGAERRDGDREDRGDHHKGLLSEGPVEQPAIAGLEDADKPGVTVAQALHLRQQVVAEHRRDGDRGHEARKDRDDVGDAQRRKQTALDAGQRKQRHEHQDDDGGRVDDP